MNRFRQQKPEEKTQEKPPKPLRQFHSDGSQGASPIKTNRGIRTVLSRSLSVILLCVVVGLGIFIVLSLFDRDEAGADQAEQSAILSSSGQIDAAELLNGYIEAMGGRDALQQIRSVRYEGRVIFSSLEKDFQIYLLLPDKGMLVTSPGERGSQKLMLNGDIAWQVIEMPDGSRELLPLGREDAQALKWSMRVHNTFRTLALEGRFAELSFREIEYLGKPCYEVTNKMPDDTNFLAILEKQTLYLLKTVETVVNGGESTEFTVIYDDHRMVSGVVEPYNTELYRDGDLNNEVMIDSIRINSGVMSSLFEIPEEISRSLLN